MINGRFSDEDTLIFEISLIASDGLEFPTDVMLDTGFSGWLAIDEQDLEALDWTYLRTIVQQTARGVSDFDICAGKVSLPRITRYQHNLILYEVFPYPVRH